MSLSPVCRDATSGWQRAHDHAYLEGVAEASTVCPSFPISATLPRSETV
jgi:hypothetical protein